MDKIDLHVHSVFSDGTLTPTELIGLAKQKGLRLIALTDHDTVNGIPEAIEASQKYDVEILPGIEFAAAYNGREIHILGFNIDYKNETFLSMLEKIQQSRDERNKKMIQNLQQLGLDVTYEELCSLAQNKSIITRAHFAVLLLQKGYVKSKNEAFKKYISDGCPAYLPRQNLTAKECIELILNINGIPVLAHPTLYNMSYNEIETMIKTLYEYGLKGVEAIYPLYSSQQKGEINYLAKKYNLKISGGSDFHGANKPNIDLGTGIGNNLSVPYSVFENLTK